MLGKTSLFPPGPSSSHTFQQLPQCLGVGDGDDANEGADPGGCEGVPSGLGPCAHLDKCGFARRQLEGETGRHGHLVGRSPTFAYWPIREGRLRPTNGHHGVPRTLQKSLYANLGMTISICCACMCVSLCVRVYACLQRYQRLCE